MIQLNKGTIEHVIVDVGDSLENLTDLTGKSARFSVREIGATSFVEADVPATVVGMSAFCLIDTTQVGYVTGRYELFLKFTSLPEEPVLGPIEFDLNA